MQDHRGPRDLQPLEVSDALASGRIVLVDVREPREFAAEHIDGAIPHPLSNFDAARLPDTRGRALVFQCGSGKRSALAVERCQQSGVGADAHLAGGIAAWKQAGLPTVGEKAGPRPGRRTP